MIAINVPGHSSLSVIQCLDPLQEQVKVPTSKKIAKLPISSVTWQLSDDGVPAPFYHFTAVFLPLHEKGQAATDWNMLATTEIDESEPTEKFNRLKFR